MTKTAKRKALQEAIPLRLDLGCGPRKPDGYLGVDIREIEGVDIVFDLAHRISVVAETEPLSGKPYVGRVGQFAQWPWADNSVDEVRSSHFVEHLTGEERIHFFNELYRVLKPGASAWISTPDWSHDCAYGDPTHKWPPMSRWYALYLNKEWREREAPHVSYTCDFSYVIAGNFDDWLATRNGEYQQFATQRYTNSLRDLCITLTKQ